MTNTVYTPWKLDPVNPMAPATKGDNIVDNVEQIIIDTPIPDRIYRIEVSNKGTLINDTGANSPQNYSILITGYNQVLGTNEANSNKNGIIIAPTLTKDFVKVLKAPLQSTYTIYDLSGKRIQSGVISSSESSVDVSSFSNGVYIIEIKTGKEVVSKRIIKE